MSGIHPSLLSFAAGAALFAVPVLSMAQEPAPATPTTNRLVSPIENFRKILTMTPVERARYLTNYPAEKREQISEKVEEYQLLPEPLRELRLHATELRWYLLPLLKMPAANRAERLKLVPEPYQKLVAARVEEWNLWPPSLQQDMLDYAGTTADIETLSPQGRREREQKLARWQALPATQRQQMVSSFQRYFELSDEEKEKTLQSLSEPERQETEKVLDPIATLSKAQQEKYMAAFQKYGDMSPREREQFLKNAERWKQMSEAEREAWRDLMKITPPGIAPPGQPSTSPGIPAPTKTNPTAGPVK